MHITKVITTGLDIKNIINVFCDPERTIPGMLADKFKNRCHHGMFITNIDEIIEMSDCVINQMGDPSMGTMDISFQASGLVYLPGEIINGCKVLSHDKEVIICSTANAYIVLGSNEILKSIQKDQIISVRVGTASYNINATKISINAYPLMMGGTLTIYELPSSSKIQEAFNHISKSLLNKVKEEHATFLSLQKSDAGAMTFFAKVLYPFKTQRESTGIEIPLLELPMSSIPANVKYIARDFRADLGKNAIYGWSDREKILSNADSTIPMQIRTDITARDIVVQLLEDYYNYMRTIREMIQIYNTPAIIKTHENIWIIYAKTKI